MEEIILNYQRVASEVKEFKLSIPVQVRYIYDKWVYRPFLGAGFGMHYLLKAKANLDHEPLEPEFPIPFIGVPVSAQDYDLTHQRKRVTWNWVFSGGVQRKLGKLLLEFRFTYERGLNNLIDADERYADQELLDKYAYVPDDMKLDNYVLTLSLLRNFSIPVKRK